MAARLGCRVHERIVRHDGAAGEIIRAVSGTLAWAYYVGRRYDALKAVMRYKADFPAQYAAVCVRLGRLDEARAAIADALKAGTRVSIAKEGATPQIEPQRTAYLNDLRAAGVPEN